MLRILKYLLFPILKIQIFGKSGVKKGVEIQFHNNHFDSFKFSQFWRSQVTLSEIVKNSNGENQE